MRLEITDSQGNPIQPCNAILRLSERNLLALLLMLERRRENPNRDTFLIQGVPGSTHTHFKVIAEEDEEHYSEQLAGVLTLTDDGEIDELRLRLRRTGDVCGG